MNSNNSNKSSYKGKQLRIGGYNTVVALVVVVIIVIVNLIVAQLPSIYTKFDTSELKLYSISDESAEIIKAVNTDITMYLVAESGAEDTIINELLGRYVSLNGKIKLQKVDPMLNPSFISKYTTAELSPSSVIVESDRRSYVIDYYDIYVTTPVFDQQTGAVIGTTSSFAGENKITSAIDYVTSENIPLMYVIGGHNEPAIDDTMMTYIKDDNIDMVALNLVATGSVPADANCVLIYNPQVDISSAEAETLLNYLKDGGNVIVINGYSGIEMPNLYSVAAYYGLEMYNGIVIEGSANNYSGYPYYLIPKMGSHEITELLPTTNMYVFMPECMGMRIMESAPRSTMKVTSLLYTTASAYLKTGEIATLEKETGDIEGVYDLGVVVTEPSPTGKTTKLMWYSSGLFINSQVDTVVSGGNSTFFLTNLSWLTEKKASISIASKTMQVQGLMITQAEANVWSAIFTIIIPLATIGIGLGIWIKRRRR
jgi:ABC-type uncharacterized transport system.